MSSTDEQVRADDAADLAETEAWLDSLDPQTTPGEAVPPEVRTVGQAVEALRQAEADLDAAVLAARQAGASWNALALPLGMSRQAVRQRFARLEDAKSAPRKTGPDRIVALGTKGAAAAEVKTTRGPAGPSDRERIRTIREWARKQGMDVNERGRIPTRVVAEYEATHS